MFLLIYLAPILKLNINIFTYKMIDFPHIRSIETQEVLHRFKQVSNRYPRYQRTNVGQGGQQTILYANYILYH